MYGCQGTGLSKEMNQSIDAIFTVAPFWHSAIKDCFFYQVEVGNKTEPLTWAVRQLYACLPSMSPIMSPGNSHLQDTLLCLQQMTPKLGRNTCCIDPQ